MSTDPIRYEKREDLPRPAYDFSRQARQPADTPVG